MHSEHNIKMSLTNICGWCLSYIGKHHQDFTWKQHSHLTLLLQSTVALFFTSCLIKKGKKKGTKFIASSAVNAWLYLSHAEGTDPGLGVVGALLKTSLVREQRAETPFQKVLLSTSCHPLFHPWQTSVVPITVLKRSCLQGTTCDTSRPWNHWHQRCTRDVPACSQEAGRRSWC